MAKKKKKSGKKLSLQCDHEDITILRELIESIIESRACEAYELLEMSLAANVLLEWFGQNIKRIIFLPHGSNKLRIQLNIAECLSLLKVTHGMQQAPFSYWRSDILHWLEQQRGNMPSAKQLLEQEVQPYT